MVLRPFGWSVDDLDAELYASSTALDDISPQPLEQSGLSVPVRVGVKWSTKPSPYVPAGFDFAEYQRIVGPLRSSGKAKSSPRDLYEDLVTHIPVFQAFGTMLAARPEDLVAAVDDVILTFSDARGLRWCRHADGQLNRIRVDATPAKP